MTSQYFSTRELSSLCEVGETTVKRWANMGLIKFHKTVGGHRKFKLEDVLEFISKNNIRLAPVQMERLNVQKKHNDAIDLDTEILIARGDVEALAARLFDSLMKFKKNEVEALLTKAVERIPSFAVIFDNMVAPVMHRVGDAWAKKQITISEEHIMTNLITEAILRTKVRFETQITKSPTLTPALTLLYTNTANNTTFDTQTGGEPAPVVVVEPPSRSVIVTTCPESELHQVALLGVALVCESLGFKVYYVGASVPFKDLELAVDEIKPDVVCMSITNARLTPPIYKRYEGFRKFLQKQDARFVVGGQFFGETKVQPLRADYRVKSCLQLEEILRENFDIDIEPLSDPKTLN
jgi:MerR family transcriptional regulator, light-induced transcriptional regulator